MTWWEWKGSIYWRGYPPYRSVPTSFGGMVGQLVPPHLFHERLKVLLKDVIYWRLGLSYEEGERIIGIINADYDMSCLWNSLLENPDGEAIRPLYDKLFELNLIEHPFVLKFVVEQNVPTPVSPTPVSWLKRKWLKIKQRL